ncbi:MAG TPA: ATP-binding protein [Bryobacteraceae bacterium]|nr:ATP-binding protein [Bryobacteraceae bacterium]
MTLSPSQRTAADGILLGLKRGDCAALIDTGSDGKTTVLDEIHRELGGVRVGVSEFLAGLTAGDPLAIEEAFLAAMEKAMLRAELVIVDDLHLIRNITESYKYTRGNLFTLVLSSILADAARRGSKLLFATSEMPWPLARRAHSWAIENFAAADFEAICSAYLDPEVSRRIDFTEIHRFAPSLNAHQLRRAALWLSHEPDAGTPKFLEYVTRHNLVSNVEIEEVEPVTWSDLRGVDDVIEALEAKIALPFENRELAAQFDLKPKRGVLLAGPPGTGKTTIGRALAHRLRGKFFLVDGTNIAGSGDFDSEIDKIFDAAKRNAPSVIFIDDADVIFAGDREPGLYRYLLTKLDGLENQSCGRVCVMMTAMEPSDIPAPLLRSGRVELWLETRLPDESARAEIFRSHLAELPPPFCGADIPMLASLSRGVTGADLKAIIEDGKLQLAYDRKNQKPARPVEEYFLDAMKAVRENRGRYRRKGVGHGRDAAIGFTPLHA